MDNKEYLNEENYQKTNKKVGSTGKILLIIGLCVLGLGILLIIIGLLNFGSSAAQTIQLDGDVSRTAGKAIGGFLFFAFGGLMSTAGFGLSVAGGIVLIISHRRGIAAYTTQQVMPVAQEGINKMAPTIGNAAKEIAKGIKEGINEADNNIVNNENK